MLLKTNGVTKRFGGLVAINNATLGLAKGTIKGLIGPNGSGKTTMFNIITGVYNVDGGNITLDGVDITGLAPDKIVSLGISRTFQNIRLFKKMTALDNVLVGMHSRSKNNALSPILSYRQMMIEEKNMYERGMELLKYFDMGNNAKTSAGNLPYGHQRILEIARALAAQPKVLLLDEPAAGMNETEKKELIDTIFGIRKDFDVTILLVEHDMDLVMTLSQDITVINFGKVIAEGSPEEVQSNELVIEAYLGRDDNK